MRPGFLFCALLAFQAASATEPGPANPAPALAKAAVSTRAVPDKAQLGEPFEVEVVLTHPRTQRYDLEAAGDETFDLVSSERSRKDGAHDATTTFRVKWSGFALGQKTTPALKLTVADGDQRGTQEVPGTAVELVSSLPADADQAGAELLDIQPPKEVPIPSYRLLWALLAALGVGAAAYALLRWLRRPRAAVPVALPPPDPLDVRTRKRLDALREEDLPGQGRVREFWFQLSEIVRDYLGERYAFEALESTTPELLTAVRKLHTPGLIYGELENFCLSSDLARYARSELSADDCKKALEFGYRLVEHTPLATRVPVHAAATRLP